MKKEARGRTHRRLSSLELNISCTSGITSLIDRNVGWPNYKTFRVSSMPEITRPCRRREIIGGLQHELGKTPKLRRRFSAPGTRRHPWRSMPRRSPRRASLSVRLSLVWLLVKQIGYEWSCERQRFQPRKTTPEKRSKIVPGSGVETVVPTIFASPDVA